MVDDQNLEEQAGQQSPVEGKAQIPSGGAENEVAEPQEQEVISSEDQKSLEERGTPNRLEKRIDNLKAKLEQAQTERDKEKISRLISRLEEKLRLQANIPPELLESEPLIKPEDYGKEIDAEELEKRLSDREQKVVLKAISAIENKQKYEAALKEHLSEWEELANDEELKGDPDLKNFVEQQYRLANFIINPFTGEEDFVPTARPKDIFASIKKILEKKAMMVGSQTLSELQSQYQESGIPPTITKPASTDYEEGALIRQAQEEGTDEAWARVLKRRIFQK